MPELSRQSDQADPVVFQCLYDHLYIIRNYRQVVEFFQIIHQIECGRTGINKNDITLMDKVSRKPRNEFFRLTVPCRAHFIWYKCGLCGL